MSGTEIACGSVSLRVCYAMSGTEIVYGPTRRTPHYRSWTRYYPLSAYARAMGCPRGTELGYASTRLYGRRSAKSTTTRPKPSTSYEVLLAMTNDHRPSHEVLLVMAIGKLWASTSYELRRILWQAWAP
eukprot:1956089-Rhodomonas_salina.2